MPDQSAHGNGSHHVLRYAVSDDNKLYFGYAVESLIKEALRPLRPLTELAPQHIKLTICYIMKLIDWLLLVIDQLLLVIGD